MTYAQQLKDPRWQRKRLEILQRADFACEQCDDKASTLHVHHGYYEQGKAPWDYPDDTLHCLCESCHQALTATMADIQRYIGALHPDRLKAVLVLLQCFHASDHDDVALEVPDYEVAQWVTSFYDLIGPDDFDEEIHQSLQGQQFSGAELKQMAIDASRRRFASAMAERTAQPQPTQEGN